MEVALPFFLNFTPHILEMLWELQKSFTHIFFLTNIPSTNKENCSWSKLNFEIYFPR